jgi:hypothetical protein
MSLLILRASLGALEGKGDIMMGLPVTDGLPRSSVRDYRTGARSVLNKEANIASSGEKLFICSKPRNDSSIEVIFLLVFFHCDCQ